MHINLCRFCKNVNLAIHYWIAYVCLLNTNLTTSVTFTCEQKEQIKEKIDFSVFEEDPEFVIVDVKDNEWHALLTVKLEKSITEHISDTEDDPTSSSCEDEFESKSNKDRM